VVGDDLPAGLDDGRGVGCRMVSIAPGIPDFTGGRSPHGIKTTGEEKRGSKRQPGDFEEKKKLFSKKSFLEKHSLNFKKSLS
jgi:hypothetical protein